MTLDTTRASAFPRESLATPGFALCATLLAILTMLRLIGLHYSVVDLYIDESQYWSWSREPAFGYFSKPPLLAWVIAAAEWTCGPGEACIRAPAPLFHLATSLICYAIARELYDRQAAFWTALTFALATGTAFSSRIISTDVPLLFCWALALLGYIKMLRGGDVRWALLFGLGLGLGLNAKYAMIYFVAGMALAAMIDREARALFYRPSTWIGFAFAAALIAPNIAWNSANGFATFKHTGDNIHGGGLALRPLQALEFLASQFAVFGPVVFGVMLVLFARLVRGGLPREDRLLLMLAIPPLALVTAVAFVRPAHANWAAPTMIAGVVVVTGCLVRERAWGWIKASVAIGIVVQAVLLVTDALAYRVHLPLIAKGDVYERTLGWRALGTETAQLVQRHNAAAVATEGRGEVSSLIYYLRDSNRQVFTWPAGPGVAHHYDLTRPLTDGVAEPVLFISPCASTQRLSQYFASVTPLGSFRTPTGPTSSRFYNAFLLSSARGKIGPLPPCG